MMKKHTPLPELEQEAVPIGHSVVVDEFLKSSLRKGRFPGDPLAHHIQQLLHLHPLETRKFAAINVGALSSKQKLSLLHNINARLGIKPLKRVGRSTHRPAKRQKTTMKPAKRVMATPMNSGRLLCG